jgi:hypothetical protein
MKYTLLVLLFINNAWSISIGETISGKIEPNSSCSKKVMVWLALDKMNYKDRLFLMHTVVPQGGTFQFNVKPGDYHVRVTDEIGCEFLQKVSVKNSSPFLSIRLRKK